MWHDVPRSVIAVVHAVEPKLISVGILEGRIFPFAL